MRWTIFCRVIDNFGDIGVCWRLARYLRDRGEMVQLWLDDLTSFAPMEPRLLLDQPLQVIDFIEIIHWKDGEHCAADLGDVVIEAFACGLEDARLAAMSARQTPPLWINLDYLSAETWVEACHLLPSKHPRFALSQIFFFPGFSAKTGGLLQPEADFSLEQSDFALDEAKKSLTQGKKTLQMSFFTYEPKDLALWLDVWQHGKREIILNIPQGRALNAIKNIQNYQSLSIDSPLKMAQLHLQAQAWRDQIGFDYFLQQCDINFVRGEDSLVRALWAGKPLFWHIYPTDDGAHFVKLQAFCDWLSADWQPDLRQCWQRLLFAFNGKFSLSNQELSELWAQFLDHLAHYQNYAKTARRKALASGDLAANLIRYAKNLV